MKTVINILLFLTAFPALGQDLTKKTSVPADEAQAKATKLVKEVYGDEWAKAKAPVAKQALAKKLLEKAAESKDDPAGQFVMLRLARDIASQAGDGQTAFQAIDAMDEVFQVDATEMKLALLTTFASTAEKPAQHQEIAKDALKLVDHAIGEDNFTAAEELGKLAVDEARSARERELFVQAKNRNNEIAELVKACQEMKAARITLEKTADDPAANLVVGKYLCFVKGDWDKGLPMLALGKDDALKKVSKQELEGVSSSIEQAKLGDAWWDLAETQDGAMTKQVRARAAYWYQKALPGLNGLAKDKVEKRVEKISTVAGPQAKPAIPERASQNKNIRMVLKTYPVWRGPVPNNPGKTVNLSFTAAKVLVTGSGYNFTWDCKIVGNMAIANGNRFDFTEFSAQHPAAKWIDGKFTSTIDAVR